MAREGDLLRHVISKQRVSVDPKKIKVVVEWPKPKTVIEVQSFLGLTRYYWRFVEGFSKITPPMTRLT